MVYRWSSQAKHIAESESPAQAKSDEANSLVDDAVDVLARLGQGEEFFRWRRVLAAIDALDVEVRAALIGAADKQHTNVKRALVDNQRFVGALWDTRACSASCPTSWRRFLTSA